MTINDLMPGVKRKLGGRTDSDEVSPLWIKDSLRELTESYPFEELKVTGPVIQFTSGINEYPLTTFTNNNENLTIINSWYVSSTTSIPAIVQSSNNTSGRFLKYRTLPVLDIMIRSLGQPSKWTRNGRNFIVGVTPDQSYATQIRYQKEHPFPADDFNVELLRKQTVYIPNSWSIIVEFHAAMIGAYEYRMLDYAEMYHTALFGDPDFSKTGKGNPGLIFSRTSNYNRDSSNNERQLQMVVLKQCSS